MELIQKFRHKRQHRAWRLFRDIKGYRDYCNRSHVSSTYSSKLSTSIRAEPGYPKKKFAWLILFACFITMTAINGLFYSFAILLVDLVEEFPVGYGSTSMILGIQAFCENFFGAPVGQAVKKYGPQPVALSGAIIAIVSMYVSSLSTQLWQLMITFGLCYGIGFALIYYPAYAIVHAWFPQKTSLAMGIIASGTGLGSMIVPIFAEYMLIHFGWRVYLQVLAAAVGGTCFLCASIYIPPDHDEIIGGKDNDVKGIVNLRFLKDPVFILLCFCAILLGLGYYSPSTHIVAYAVDNGISRARASRLVVYGGAAMFSGRIILGYIGSLISIYYFFSICVVISGCATALAPLYSSDMHFIVYYVVFQFFCGVYAAIFPVIISRSMGKGQFIQAFGLIRTAETASVVLSTSFAGWIRDYYGSYDYAFVATGVLFCVSVIPVLLIPPILAARKKNVKTKPKIIAP